MSSNPLRFLHVSGINDLIYGTEWVQNTLEVRYATRLAGSSLLQVERAAGSPTSAAERIALVYGPKKTDRARSEESLRGGAGRPGKLEVTGDRNHGLWGRAECVSCRLRKQGSRTMTWAARTYELHHHAIVRSTSVCGTMLVRDLRPQHFNDIRGPRCDSNGGTRS